MRHRPAEQRGLGDFARTMRQAPTKAEDRLWQGLRRHFMRAKFRRQVPIGPYIADFACLEHRLVIEVDGGQHQDCERDVRRDAWLRRQGYTVLRFWNHEVLGERQAVLMAIAEAVALRCPPAP